MCRVRCQPLTELWRMGQIQKPKTEIRRKAEVRSPNEGCRCDARPVFAYKLPTLTEVPFSAVLRARSAGEHSSPYFGHQRLGHPTF